MSRDQRSLIRALLAQNYDGFEIFERLEKNDPKMTMNEAFKQIEREAIDLGVPVPKHFEPVNPKPVAPRAPSLEEQMLADMKATPSFDLPRHASSRKRDTQRPIQAWIERDDLDLLVKNNVNISELVRGAVAAAVARLRRGGS